jgi:general secretion pathway protein H
MNGKMQGGFSLLELLVALFVVVIITSLVTLTVNSGGQDVELDAKVRSLADISSYALDEAQMRSVDMGLLIERVDEREGTAYVYSWRERTPEGWRRPIVDADIFGSQRFPTGLELSLEVEDTLIEVLSAQELALEEPNGGLSDTQNEVTDEVLPQVIFYSSGEATVASIQLRQEKTGDVLWRIEWDLLGRSKLLRRGELSEDEIDESR